MKAASIKKIMIWLNEKIEFPPVEWAREDGLLAVGGDLSEERLLLAYREGIFPWYNEYEPIVWWSPDPRMILFPDQLKISKSMDKLMKSGKFHFSINHTFKEVIQACSEIKRKGQNGTWISPEMMEAYIGLHGSGYAYSVEVWEEDQLVGGLYGILLGRIFCGESMFSKVSNASKAALIYLVKEALPNLVIIDCQVYNDHLASLGAAEIPRKDFMHYLNRYSQ